MNGIEEKNGLILDKLPANVTDSGEAVKTQKSVRTESRCWLALYVKIHHERKLAKALQEKGFEVFLPIQECVCQWSDRRKKIQKVVIPMIIFVYVNEQERLQILQYPSSVRYITNKETHRPCIIPNNQMEQFKFMLDYSEEAIEMCSEQFFVGQKVYVVTGPLAGLEGELVDVNGDTKIVVCVDLLGSACVSMKKNMVKRIK